MDWTTIIQELGGGLPAIVIAGMAVFILRLMARNDALTDKLIEQSADQTAAMNELTRALDRQRGGS